MILDDNIRPKNESKIHYELKQIGNQMLFKMGFFRVMNEVNVGRSNFELQKQTKGKHITDCLGLKIKNMYLDKELEFETRSIESKATYADFKNGYCCSSDFNYVIAPKGVIPKEELIDCVGLIEVDLANYRIVRRGKDIEILGVTITKRPKRNKLKPMNFKYKNYMSLLMYDMLLRSTQELVIKYPNIKIIRK